ncbi:hypothetical protein [Ochrobactrum sp. Marseille-Q0166]|uniref:hypothetical protein n=1 Tax=Ochrobactrum sp. Marseille-Q0166 TaxID=2761105 RepID=UPI001AED7AAD|nr:hypothetical protein [Ochrobactrum sp. Marseille-Q0166]
MIADTHKPIVLAGGGVHLSDAANVLTAFSQALNLPVAHTLTGKGAIPYMSTLSAGLFGRYDRIANKLIEEFGRTTDCDLALSGDVGATISELQEMLAARSEAIRTRQADYASKVGKRMDA